MSLNCDFCVILTFEEVDETYHSENSYCFIIIIELLVALLFAC